MKFTTCPNQTAGTTSVSNRARGRRWTAAWAIAPLVGGFLLAGQLAGCLGGGTCDTVDCSNLGGGSGGGAAGGMGGGGMSFPCSARENDVAARSLEGCEAHATVADFESGLLRSKCGTAGCHRQANATSTAYTAPGILTMGGAFVRLAGVKSTTSRDGRMHCADSDFIDLANPDGSWLLAKLEATPACPSGGSAGDRMPPAPGGAELTAEEKACFQAYVRAVAAGCQ